MTHQKMINIINLFVDMNWKEKFIVEVVWRYFRAEKYKKYTELINKELYTDSQAYNVTKNL